MLAFRYALDWTGYRRKLIVRELKVAFELLETFFVVMGLGLLQFRLKQWLVTT